MNSISACGTVRSLVDELLRHVAATPDRIEAIILSSDMAEEVFCHYISLYELHGRERNTGRTEDESAFRLHGISALRDPFLPSGQIRLVMRTKTIKLIHAA